MNSLVQRVRRHFLSRRWAAAGFCGLLGAAALAGLATADQVAVPPAALIGFALSFAYVVRRYLWKARSGAAIEPSSDPDGCLRAALSLPAGHPYAERLSREAAAREVRFRPVGEIVPLAVLASSAWLWSAWTLAAPGLASPAPSVDGLARQGGGAPPAADPSAATTAGAESGQDRAGQGSTGESPRPDAGGGAQREPGEPRWQAVETNRASGDPTYLAGRDFGASSEAVRRYLAIRGAEDR